MLKETCKTCKYWGEAVFIGEPDKNECTRSYAEDKPYLFIAAAEAGVWSVLLTSPGFGCNQWEAKFGT